MANTLPKREVRIMKKMLKVTLLATMLLVCMALTLASCVFVDSSGTTDTVKQMYEEKIATLEKEHAAKIAELEAAAKANAEAKETIEAAYNAKVAELEAAQTANAAALEALKAEHEKNTADLKAANENNKSVIAVLEEAYNAKIAELEAEQTAHAEAIATLTAEYEARIAELEAAGGADPSELAALQAAYDAKVAELEAEKANNAQKITNLTAEHNAKVAELEAEIAANETSIANLQSSYNAKVAELEAERTANATALANLKSEHAAQIAALEKEAEDNAAAMAQLKESYENTIAGLESELDELRGKIKHTVLFDTKGASVSYDEVKVAEGATVTAPANPERNGYNFVGWYVDGEKVSFPYTVWNSTVFEAVYSPITYGLIYNTNGGTMPAVYDTFYTADMTIKLPTPTREGYIFLGWYASADLKGERVLTIKAGEFGNKIFYANWDAVSGGVIYTLSEDGTHYVVTGIDGTEIDLAIAESVDGIPVTEIAESAFKGKQKITSVSIPDSVTKIGKSAFEGCISLQSLHLGSGIGEIPPKMAYGCTKLEAIEIPGSAKTIGDSAFYECVALAELVIPNGVVEIGYSAFRFCDSLINVVIPDSVVTIYEVAFSECDNIESVKLGNSVQYIGFWAFLRCYKLSNVNIPSSVKTIGRMAFESSSLEEIYIPASVTDIGDKAFNYTPLKSIDVSNDNPSYMSIDGVLYTKDGKTLIQYPREKENTSFVIPDGVEKIEDSAFVGCEKIRNVTIPEGVISIGTESFNACSNLMKIVIPDTVVSIGGNAFSGCASLTTVTIGRNVSDIGDYAFYSEYLYIIYNNSDLLFEFGSGSNGYITRNAKIIIDNGRPTYRDDGFEYILTDDGFLFKYDGSVYTLLAYTGDEETVTLPENINGDSYEIYKMRGVVNVVIPDSVVQIGNCAFYSCTTLQNVTVCNGVTSIGKEAFRNCDNLLSFVIPDSVTDIDQEAFSGCDNLAFISIGNGVKKISFYAFDNCEKLTAVVIGNGVNIVYQYAFRYCSNLTSVYYTGTADDWNKISIYNENDYLKNATRYYYSETQPTTEGNFWHYVDGQPVAWGEIHEHSYAENTVAATCSDAGSTTYTCDCGHSYTEAIEALGHNYSTTFVAPTATDDGYNENVCTRCFHSYNDAYVVTTPFTVTSSNRADVGYTGEANEVLDIPAVFEKNGTWYRVTAISGYAFDKSSNLVGVVIPDSVIEIGPGAFQDAWNLASVTIGKGVKTIRDYSFTSCPITSVVLPEGVTTIADSFYGCSKLVSVSIPKSLTSIGDSAFFGCTALKSINVDDANEVYKSIDGVLYTEDGTILIHYPSSRGVSVFTVPADVTVIGANAFREAKLDEVILHDNITEIKERAFIYAKIKSITLPNISYIGEYTFDSCENLTSIIIPDTVERIDGNAFGYCESLETIVIGSGVTEIGYRAFYGCDKLTSVHYNGSESEWSSIKIDYENTALTSASIYYS